MYKYAISFRIDNATHTFTYGERYQSLVEQIRISGAWEETTSFALISSDETIEELAGRLYINSHFNAAYDLMLIIDIERGVAISRGPLVYPATLKSKLNAIVLK